MMLLALLGFLLVVLATFITSMWLFVPFVPTPKRVIVQMLKLAKLEGTETVYDLGCGDARILIAAKRVHPDIRAIGYELPIGVWLLAKIRVLLSGKNIAVRLGNYLKADLSDADVILIYLVPEVMNTLKHKLDAQLKPGAVVISHGFPFEHKEPIHMERVPLPVWHAIRPPKREGPRVFVYTW